MNGEGRPESGYPRIAGQPPAYLERQLEAYADGRRQSVVMGPLAQRLTKEERASVAAHFSSQWGSSIKKQNQSPGSERGGTLARVGDNDLRVQACQNCHGPEGTGQPPTGPYLAGLDRAYLRRELMAWRDGSRRTDPSGAMGIIARHLTEADIDAVAAHYAGLAPPRAADY
jgi:cytochrome c553